MTLSSARVALVLSLAAGLPGCFDVKHGETKTAEDVVKTEPKVVARGSITGKASLDGSTLVVNARQGCALVEMREVKRTTTTDNRFESGTAGGLTAIGVIGSLPLTGGVIMLADSPRVFDNDSNSRTYNPTGKTAAIAIGTVLTLVGTTAVAIPIVNAARAAGSETTSTTENREGKTLRADSPCDGNIASQPLAVTAQAPNGSAASLGSTDAQGHLQSDLKVSLASWFNQPVPPVSAGILVNGQFIGEVDVSNVARVFFEERDKADELAWGRTEFQACAQQKNEQACAGVRNYLQALPAGRHADEARTLLGKFAPQSPVVAADDAADLLQRAVTEAANASNLAANKVREKAQTDQQKALLKAETDALRAGKQACQETCKKVCEEPPKSKAKVSPGAVQECKTSCNKEACQ